MADGEQADQGPADYRLAAYAAKVPDWDEHLFGAFPGEWYAKPHAKGCCDCAVVNVQLSGAATTQDLAMNGKCCCCRRFGCESWNIPTPYGEAEMKSKCCSGSWETTFPTGERVWYARPIPCNYMAQGYQLFPPNSEEPRYEFFTKFGCGDCKKLCCPCCFKTTKKPAQDTWLNDREGKKILEHAGRLHSANFGYKAFMDYHVSIDPCCCGLCPRVKYINDWPDDTDTGIYVAFQGIEQGNPDDIDKRLFAAVVMMENIRVHFDANKEPQTPYLVNEKNGLLKLFSMMHPTLTTPPTVNFQPQIKMV